MLPQESAISTQAEVSTARQSGEQPNAPLKPTPSTVVQSLNPFIPSQTSPASTAAPVQEPLQKPASGTHCPSQTNLPGGKLSETQLANLKSLPSQSSAASASPSPQVTG
jgi:hypothetical protein